MVIDLGHRQRRNAGGGYAVGNRQQRIGRLLAPFGLFLLVEQT